jgi:hypothetical protein
MKKTNTFTALVATFLLLAGRAELSGQTLTGYCWPLYPSFHQRLSVRRTAETQTLFQVQSSRRFVKRSPPQLPCGCVGCSIGFQNRQQIVLTVAPAISITRG